MKKNTIQKNIVFLFLVYISFLFANPAYSQSNNPPTPAPSAKTDNKTDNKAAGKVNTPTPSNTASTKGKNTKVRQLTPKEEEERQQAIIEAAKNKKLEEDLTQKAQAILELKSNTDSEKTKLFEELVPYLREKNKLTSFQKTSFDTWQVVDRKVRNSSVITFLKMMKDNFRANKIMVDIYPQNMDADEIFIDIRFLNPKDATIKNYELLYKYLGKNHIDGMTWLEILKGLNVNRLHFNRLEDNNFTKIIDQKKL